MIAYSTPGAIIAVTVTLTILCSVLVVLRFFTRRPEGKRSLPDDWLCLAALIMTWAMAISVFVGVAHESLGRPVPKDPTAPAKVIEVEKLEWIVQMFQVLQLGFTKLSFVVLFRRIFVTHSKSAFSVAAWIMIAVLVAWTVAFFFGFLFACGGHFDRWWLHPQSCPGPGSAPGLAFENGFALSEVLIDFFIIIMPVPMIWRLHMTTHRKVAVTGIFGLGVLAIIISIVRLIIFYQAKSATVGSGVDHDQLITLIIFWSMIESTVALIAACLPVTYNAFGKRIVESIVNSAHSLRQLSSRGSGSRSDARGSNGTRRHTTGATINNLEPNTVDTDTLPMVPKTSSSASVASFGREQSSMAKGVVDGRILAETTITQTHSQG